MDAHAACKKVRLVDRCVECNPGYNDPNQAFWIYREQKRTKADLREVEQSYIDKFGRMGVGESSR